MKISGVSCITKKIFLVFLGHPKLSSFKRTPGYFSEPLFMVHDLVFLQHTIQPFHHFTNIACREVKSKPYSQVSHWNRSLSL